jgi:acyl-coenzyme A thioesterase PaaI-like protein
LFTRGVRWRVPYFASIRPEILVLERGRCTVRLCAHRRVRNHLGTIHAIASCNAAELAMGMTMESLVPRGYRWIPRGMRVEYLAKAHQEIRATASARLPDLTGESVDLDVPVRIRDEDDRDVLTVVITVRVGPVPGKEPARS